MYKKRCHSAVETTALGEQLANFIKPGDVLTLEGDLGAGKTTFTKGLAKGLGVTGMVNSPTFTIIKEYEGRIPLYHMDVYRISDDEDLGFEEYFDGNGVTVIEWAMLIEGHLPDSRLEMSIHLVENGMRDVFLKPIGQRYEQLCEELLRHEYIGH